MRRAASVASAVSASSWIAADRVDIVFGIVCIYGTGPTLKKVNLSKNMTKSILQKRKKKKRKRKKTGFIWESVQSK